MDTEEQWSQAKVTNRDEKKLYCQPPPAVTHSNALHCPCHYLLIVDLVPFVKNFELPLCLKATVQINLDKLAMTRVCGTKPVSTSLISQSTEYKKRAESFMSVTLWKRNARWNRYNFTQCDQMHAGPHSWSMTLWWELRNSTVISCQSCKIPSFIANDCAVNPSSYCLAFFLLLLRACVLCISPMMNQSLILMLLTHETGV